MDVNNHPVSADEVKRRKDLDVRGPGIGDYEGLRAILPDDYSSLLDVKETQRAIARCGELFQQNLREQLNLIKVTVPLFVEDGTGINDMLDRDGSRTPVGFHIPNDGVHELDCTVVQACTKWKRMACRQFGFKVGEGLQTDMRAIRKNYFLDHDHSAYVDQYEFETVLSEDQRNLDYLKDYISRMYKAFKLTEKKIQEEFPALASKYDDLPEEITFLHAEEILDMYPDLPRKERETEIARKYKAVFIIGIGWNLADGYPHELRAPDYDDWCTPTTSSKGEPCNGLNGDILVWNPVTQRRHELCSMGIRVNAEGMLKQLELCNCLDWKDLLYHRQVIDGSLPLTIGGGIGQSRTIMLLLKKAHLGEVHVSVWPKVLKEMCKEKNIHLLE